VKSNAITIFQEIASEPLVLPPSGRKCTLFLPDGLLSRTPFEKVSERTASAREYLLASFSVFHQRHESGMLDI
jgi:hypothetical protein